MIQSCCASRSIHSVPEPHLQGRFDPISDVSVVDLGDLNLHTLPDVVVQNSHQIEHLLLDENNFNEKTFEGITFPNLKSLSLNSNKIKNVGVFIQLLAWKCPNLTFLSLIGNPGWPHPVLGGNAVLYGTLATTVASFLPRLQFLDSMPVPEGAKNVKLPSQCRIQ
uniref:LRRCT domain-containing protein n=1 Tax=Panagrellus redivivus TaxID=6233 RepID=A0A7E4VK26_PANRE